MKVAFFVMIIGLALMPIEAISQVVGPAPPPTGITSPVENNQGPQLTASAAVVLFMDWLKRTKWASWITAETVTINRVAAVVLSFLAAVGVQTTFDHAAGTLVVTGLTLTGIATLGVAWIKSYVYQQTIFKMSSREGI